MKLWKKIVLILAVTVVPVSAYAATKLSAKNCGCAMGAECHCTHCDCE